MRSWICKQERNGGAFAGRPFRIKCHSIPLIAESLTAKSRSRDGQKFRVASALKNLYSPEFYYRDPPLENKTWIRSLHRFTLDSLDG